MNQAPSFKELPPQKGTLLVLHSMNDANLDGKLVEYLRRDSDDNRNIFVGFFGSDIKLGPIRLKKCRRPDVRPYQERNVLSHLTLNFLERIKDTKKTYTEEDKAWHDAKLLAFLEEKDPCCATAHEALGWSALHGDPGFRGKEGPSKETALVAAGHFRRAARSYYAYKGLVIDDLGYEERLDGLVADYLFEAGEYGAAARAGSKVPRAFDTALNCCKCVHNELTEGLALMKRSEEMISEMAGPQDFSKRIKKMMAGARRFLKVVELGAYCEQAFGEEGDKLVAMGFPDLFTHMCQAMDKLKSIDMFLSLNITTREPTDPNRIQLLKSMLQVNEGAWHLMSTYPDSPIFRDFDDDFFKDKVEDLRQDLVATQLLHHIELESARRRDISSARD